MSEMVGLRVLGLTWVVAAGCASIRVQESVLETPLPPTVRDACVPDSVKYAATAVVDAEVIRVSVEQSETCAELTTQRSHRVRTVVRTADPVVTRTTWATAALGLGGGVYSYANADALAERDPDGLTGQDYRQYGLGVAAVGVGAIVLAVIDGLRATDSEHDDGVINGASTRIESTCRRRPTQHRDIALVLARGHSVEARLDNRGQAEFSLLATPEAGLPDSATSIVATIGVDRVQIYLTSAQRLELRSALVANSRSRVAIDALERRRAACAQAVAMAHEQTPAEPDEAAEPLRAVWLSAKSSCTDLWTRELEAELAGVDRRIEAGRCNRRALHASESLTGDITEISIDMVAIELDGIREHCPMTTVARQLRQLDARLVSMTKQIERVRVEETRRIARQAAQAAKEARRQQQQSEQRHRSWGSARLLCNDGTLSPSCTCGRGSYRGCCSWHGGVNSCSADRQ